VRWNGGYASITCFSTYAVLFVLEKTKVSSVSAAGSELAANYTSCSTLRVQPELRRLTLAHERHVGLKAAYARAKQAEI
jgi:hypothetical protein